MKKIFKATRSDADARRHAWWGVFALGLLLILVDFLHVAGSL